MKKGTFALVATVLLVAAGCGDDADAPSEAARPSQSPGPAPEFWSTPADTPEQQAAVAQATRQLDVCALIPRDVLGDLGQGDVQRVAVGLDSCRATLGKPDGGENVSVTWHTTLLPRLVPKDGVADKQLGDVQVLVVPDRDTDSQACGATARFPAGAGFYVGLSGPSRDSCALADGLLPRMIERWRESPAQGSSPDTVTTALLGADPCAVRAKLADTTDTDQRRLTQCLFRYRNETVTVGYEYRVTDEVDTRSTEEKIDNRTVFRSTSVYDDSIPIYTAPVGPELPSDSTDSVPRTPVVTVTSATDDVAKQVMSQVLPLFPE